MIVGVGTDLVKIERLAHSLRRFGDRYAQRILTEAEYEDFQTAANPAAFLAKRFAAKEAMAKAMGTGFRDGLSLQHIGVSHTALGQPVIQCTDIAADYLQQHNISQVHLSLSDEKEHALAFVVLERS